MVEKDIQKENVDVSSIILSIIEESEAILIEDLYRLLKQKYGINRVEAGKCLIKLCGEGKISSHQYYYVKRTC